MVEGESIMAGEIPSFFDHIPITQNTINAIRLQKLMKKRITQPIFDDYVVTKAFVSIIEESEKE